jgi:AhpC/TSA family
MNLTRRNFVSTLPALSALATSSPWQKALAQDNAAAREKNAAPMPALGSRIALPALSLLDGTPFSPANAKSRIIVLYWWASTCPFCALQSPEMQTLWLTHQNQGLQLLALSVDKTPADALAYLKKKAYTFPSAWVSPEVHQALPKPKGLPITLALDHNGKVLQAERGQMFAEDVAQLAKWLVV